VIRRLSEIGRKWQSNGAAEWLTGFALTRIVVAFAVLSPAAHAADVWSPAGSTPRSCYPAAGAVLPDGRALVAGAIYDPAAVLSDPRTDAWERTAPNPDLLLLRDGRMLITGRPDERGAQLDRGLAVRSGDRRLDAGGQSAPSTVHPRRGGRGSTGVSWA
jgi:hypothetical protein